MVVLRVRLARRLVHAPVDGRLRHLLVLMQLLDGRGGGGGGRGDGLLLGSGVPELVEEGVVEGVPRGDALGGVVGQHALEGFGGLWGVGFW